MLVCRVGVIKGGHQGGILVPRPCMQPHARFFVFCESLKAQEVEAHGLRRRVVEGFVEQLVLRQHLAEVGTTTCCKKLTRLRKERRMH